jgi:hypothetical protein
VSDLRSSATSRFWKLFAELPEQVQELATEKYELFKRDPYYHPSLGFQAKGKVWTVDIGRHHRAIGFGTGNQLSWFWIGSHEDYNTILKRLK